MEELACQILKDITKLKPFKKWWYLSGKRCIIFLKKQNKNIGEKYTDQCVCGFTVSERWHLKQRKGD